jgi:hypothetical protein
LDGRRLAVGCFEAIVQDLRILLRRAPDRPPPPSAAILDARTIQSTPERGARAGYDGHKRRKRRKGSKVQVAGDTAGHLLALLVTGEHVELAYVNQGSTGEAPATAAAAHGIWLAVVTLPAAKRGFVLLPRRELGGNK